MIYVPNINYDYYYYNSPYIYAFNGNDCYSSGYNTQCNYIRWDISNHYFSNNGTMNLSNSINYYNKADLTNDFYYRNDFDSILIIFFIIAIFAFYIPFKIIMRLFRRFN